MKRILFPQIAAFLFLFVIVLFHKPAYSQTQKVSLLQGTVSSNYGVIPKVKVIFFAGNLKYEVTANDDGSYEAYLPSDTYQVSTQLIGLCPVQRASFYVKPSSKQILNLTLYPCAIESGFIIDNKGKVVSEFCKLVPPFKTESFSLSKVSNALLNLHITFSDRKEKGNIIEYGRVSDSDPISVIVTYDVLTLSANKVWLDKESLKLEAEGNVIVEDGKQQYTFSNVEVDFKAKDPIASIKGK